MTQTTTTDTTETTSEAASPNARELLKSLHDAYPVLANHQPLAIGIDKQLLAAQPGINRKQLRLALGMHTHTVRYLKTLQEATQRFDLAGNAAGEVTAEQREVAGKELVERFRKRAQANKAAVAAKQAAEKKERAEKERVQKLDQLVSKFSRK
ncbi:ProQ/FinO family protein [Uliginosibacterium sp. H1]|uniref:ProQ/FinO family protein n=1 Tax=Uliginosibacterium sp. H1 TaxID=3114757 RepID=UPI002E16C0A8|nr:ProQ/FinO family protein [Uliginosibacterium sp. H1]